MSGPLGPPVDFNHPSSFAPKWILQAFRAAKSDASSKGIAKSVGDALSRSRPFINVSDEGTAIERGLPHSHEPTRQSEPLPVSGSRSANGVLWRSTLAVTAGLAFLFVDRPWGVWRSGANKSGNESSSIWALSVAQTRAEPANHGDAKLIVHQAAPRRMGEAYPLGVSVRDSGDGDLLVVRGLASGATLSAGGPVGDNYWWLPATNLNHVVIQPPLNFVGAMDITIELRFTNTALSDSQTLHFEWLEPDVPAPRVKSEAEVPESNLQNQPIQQLAPVEIAALLNRGNDLISSGDLAAARLVLRRAAEAGNAGAALALAGTYDPPMLQRLPVHGLSPDLTMARHWYEKAKELGSPDASQRLETLARRPD